MDVDSHTAVSTAAVCTMSYAGLYRWRRAIWRIAIWMPSVPSGNDTLPPLPSGGIKYMLLVVNNMLLNVNYMLLIVKYMVLMIHCRSRFGRIIFKAGRVFRGSEMLDVYAPGRILFAFCTLNVYGGRSPFPTVGCRCRMLTSGPDSHMQSAECRSDHALRVTKKCRMQM